MSDKRVATLHPDTTWLPKTQVLRKGVILFGNFLSGFLVISLATHFLIKDRIAILSIMYYATPLPILAMTAFVIAIIQRFGKQNRLARFSLCFAIGCLIAWPCQSLSFNSPTQASGDLKLFFWNTAKNRWTPEIVTDIQNENADIIGIVESGVKNKNESQWREAFPGYHVAFLRKQMLLITKGEIIEKERGSLNKHGYYNLLKITLRGKLFTVVLVDIDADPLRSRAAIFKHLDMLIQSHSQENLIVMGDFNTPLQSVYFEPFREYLRHAFESAGNGLVETWPTPIPLLSIDHIWVASQFVVTDCDLITSPLSDHCAVSAKVDVSDKLASTMSAK